MQKPKAPKSFSFKASTLREMSVAMAMVFGIAIVLTVIACEHGNSAPISNSYETRSSGQNTSDDIKLELTSNGFVPAQVTHEAGVFAIEVENKSGVEEYTLRLTAQDGTILKEVSVNKGSAAWTVNLQPGQYSLKEANHEQWVCAIAVQ
jgi:hypothetical protein